MEVPSEKHHSHGPLFPEVALGTHSLDFAYVFNRATVDDHVQRKWSPWMLLAPAFFCVGLLTSIIAFFVAQCGEFIAKNRADFVIRLVNEGFWWKGWIWNWFLMSVLSILGALPVLTFAPNAGSSGIPAVIALLNGCDIRENFTLRTLMARIVGVMFAVSSGLVVGPEGPMIFIGACVGALVTNVLELPRVKALFHHGLSGRDAVLRDCVMVGAGAGIGAAFRAPIAGTMFVVEEAASRLKKRHLHSVFFGSVMALFFIIVFTAGRGILKYPVASGYGCDLYDSMGFFNYAIPAVIIGILCGVAGAAFNGINVRISEWRAIHERGNPVLKALDILAICFLTATSFIAITYTFGEELPTTTEQLLVQSKGCIRNKWKHQFLVQGDFSAGTMHGHREYEASIWELLFVPHLEEATEMFKPRSGCLYGVQYNPLLCEQAFDLALNASADPAARGYAKSCTEDVFRGTSLIQLPPIHRQHYCCGFNSVDELARGKYQFPGNASCFVNLGKGLPTLDGTCIEQETHADLTGHATHRRLETMAVGESECFIDQKSYNPMASLALTPLGEMVSNLFVRGMPYLFPLRTLLVLFPVVFLMTVLIAGSALPAGLLLPQMACGAILGRAVGVSLVMLRSLFPPTPFAEHPLPEEWQKLFSDHGGPVDVSTAVLAQSGAEYDPGILAFLGAAAFLAGSGRIVLFVTVMFIEITGDRYMILPVGIATFVAFFVGDLINEGLYHSLIHIQSFPFLQSEWPAHLTDVFVRDIVDAGSKVDTIDVSATQAVVERILESSDHHSFPVVDSEKNVVGIVDRDDLEALLDPELESYEFDTDEGGLGKVTNFHNVTVTMHSPLEMAFALFKKMEMRHLIVVNDSNTHPVTVLARRDIMPWRVERRLGLVHDSDDESIVHDDSLMHESS